MPRMMAFIPKWRVHGLPFAVELQNFIPSDETISYLDLQSTHNRQLEKPVQKNCTQNNGLHPNIKGVWAIVSGTLGVQTLEPSCWQRLALSL